MNKIICIIFLILLPVSSVQAQSSSILAQILDAQPSLVSVESEMSGWFKKPGAQIGIDRREHVLAMSRKIGRASYHRSGAGVIVHSSGVIVTNAHNVKNADRVTVVLANNSRIPARLVTLVDYVDLALLQIQPPFPLRAIPIADSDKIVLGEDIMTVGNSPLLKQTVSGGKIIGLGTVQLSSPSGPQPTSLIQTSLNLYKGDSGGPLFNRQGYLIGLLTAGETTSRHSSVAIPSNQIRRYLEEYLQSASLPGARSSENKGNP